MEKQIKSDKEKLLMYDWLSKEMKRLSNSVLGQNETIIDLEAKIEMLRQALEYCSLDDEGTSYQQRKARQALVQLDKNVKSPENKEKLEKVRDEMCDLAYDARSLLSEYNILIGRTKTRVNPNGSRTVSPYGR